MEKIAIKYIQRKGYKGNCLNHNLFLWLKQTLDALTAENIQWSPSHFFILIEIWLLTHIGDYPLGDSQ